MFVAGMSIKIFITLLFFFAAFTAVAQLPDNRISWQKDALTWNDFLGPIDGTSPFHASTNSGLSYSWSMKSSNGNIDFNYIVETFFLPDNSWVITDKATPHLLSHEQLHFDITELHGRKLRQAMKGFDPMKTKDVKVHLKKLYTATETGRKQMQERFDLETDHSRDKAAQEKWQKFLDAELKKLEEFSG